MSTTITLNPFTRLTARFDAFLLSLQPCARALCTWLHRLYYSDRLSNGELLIDLTEFEDYSANRAKAPYTIRWIRRCYQQLLERGFIEEIRRSSANVRRIRLVHPDEVADLETKILNSPDRDLESQNGNFKSTLGTSNPHSTVAESRSGNFKSSIAMENEQEGASSTIQAPAGDKSELLTRAKNLGAALTPALMQAVAAATYQQAANAIARVAEHIESGGHIKKSVDAFINFAIQNEAYPNSQRRRRHPAAATPPPPAAAASPTPPPPEPEPKEEASPEPAEMPQQLREWYELAHSCKVAIGYRWKNGAYQFYLPDESWVSWEVATAAWSLRRLKKMATELDSVTKSS